MWLEDIRDYLIAQGVAQDASTTPNAPWPIYIGFIPDDQDQVVGLFTTGGFPADTLLRANRRLTMQLRVRAASRDFATAYAQYQSIFNLLQDANQVAGSPILLPNFVFMQAIQVDPLHFNDEHSRPNLTSNWRIMLQLA